MHHDLRKMIDNAGFGRRYDKLDAENKASFLGGFAAAAWTFATWQNGEQICGVMTRFKDLGDMIDKELVSLLEKGE